MKTLHCKIFGHKLTKTSPQASMINEYKCTCCRKQFTKDGYGALVVLNDYWRRNNENLRASFSTAS